MNVDAHIAQLLANDGMGDKPFIDPEDSRTQSGSSVLQSSKQAGGSGQGGRVAADIVGSITDAFSSTFSTIYGARADRERADLEAQAARAGALDPYGIGQSSVSTPWGTIAIGGVVGLVILGGIFYVAGQATKGKR